MNLTALNKLKETLSLAAEFVKDENTYRTGGYLTADGCSSAFIINSFSDKNNDYRKKSDDIRTEAEQKASKLERQEKCAKQIQECLEYLKVTGNFENTNKPEENNGGKV